MRPSRGLYTDLTQVHLGDQGTTEIYRDTELRLLRGVAGSRW
ncbi:hypothetical protein ACIQ6K_19765 [Streptomyces sp. NPDC096354]